MNGRCTVELLRSKLECFRCFVGELYSMVSDEFLVRIWIPACRRRGEECELKCLIENYQVGERSVTMHTVLFCASKNWRKSGVLTVAHIALCRGMREEYDSEPYND